MGKLIDIALPQGGIIITLFRFIQFAILTGNEFLDLNMSIYKLGIHLHFVLEKENRCREIK
jgi:hypothetical protein